MRVLLWTLMTGLLWAGCTEPVSTPGTGPGDTEAVTDGGAVDISVSDDVMEPVGGDEQSELDVGKASADKDVAEDTGESVSDVGVDGAVVEDVQDVESPEDDDVTGETDSEEQDSEAPLEDTETGADTETGEDTEEQEVPDGSDEPDVDEFIDVESGAPDAGGDPLACPPDFEFFKETIQEDILTPVCSTCHQAAGPGAYTQFVLVDSTAGENWKELNFETALGVAQMNAPDGTSLILSKPSGTHPGGHVGGNLLVEGSEEYEWMATFAARARDEVPCGEEVVEETCDPLTPGPRALRRLSRSEVRATLKDLLFLEEEPEVEMASDPVVEGFDNNLEAIVVSPLFAEQIRVAAEDLSAEAVALHFDQLVPCDVAEGIACAESFVRTFGERAFRRPLGDGDVGRYLTLFVEAFGDEGFQGGVRWTIAAMLQSPHFLYRSELGKNNGEGVFELSAWELASQLSYLVWGTMPDTLLFEAAESGVLLTEEGLASELSRLLQDERANTTLQQFFGQWLRIETLPVVVRDVETYPELTPEIREHMLHETGKLIDAVLENGSGTLDDLLMADFTFLNQELADYYGIELENGASEGDGFQWVSLESEPYGGLLTQGSVLTTHALPVSSSPIHRGLLVREQLLCEDLPLPPANLDTSPPPMDPTLSTRDRYAMHSELAACAACHDKIDPIGFGFEHFDGIGRYREMDNGHPVDDSGSIDQTFGDLVPFEGAAELAEKLAENSVVEACFARKWMRFATGLDAEEDLSCATSSVEEDMIAAGGPLMGGFEMLTNTTHFRLRAGEAGELDGPAAGADVPGPGIPADDLPEGPATPDVNAIVEFTDQWETGYCVNVVVVNTTEEPVVWEVELEFNGTVGTPWNANVELIEGQLYRFWGVAWNATLAPGASADFGFCGTL